MSSSFTVQCSLLPSCALHHHDQTPSTKAANFAQIPSWVSLKFTAPSINTRQIESGQVENVHLVSLSKQGKLKEARDFLKHMNEAGVSVSPQSYKCLFEKCGLMGSLSDGKFVHDWLRKTIKSPPEFLENDALQMYCDCGSLSDAQKMFDEMLHKNLVSWVIIISAYAQKGILKRAILMFSHMLESGIRPNSSIFTSLLRSLTEHSLLELGKQIHSYLIRTGMNSNVSIDTSIANMYVKCGWLEGAKLVFDRMADKNAVVWTGLMVGYTEDEKLEEVLELFAEMVRKSVEVDDFVFSIILKACAGLEDLIMGRQIHGYSVKLGLDSEVSVGTPLVDFYVKCANLESACRAFERIHEPNDVSWSAIISGYCQVGNLRNVNLGTQVHADAIKRGLVALLHGAKPTIDHYDCMIDVYSRAGLLQEALELIKGMPFEPDAMSWKSLLGGCWIHRNLELGKFAAENLLQLDPEDTASYIIMFNLYASSGKWEEAAATSGAGLPLATIACECTRVCV
ncbi:pentatricopeptide repeat-containing protein [Prunus yedoensis var. nudiflora]|uniref:Pentatricopeptide repeat-containing protein n=1 Tax=Prunus yedoensis var. nudiflora TaxID=2094558 RepID=A0A314XQ16_PRUYE|nr:pentatricopeptide repeat-containing protein [Prunus yedoensis var. nudiflora]